MHTLKRGEGGWETGTAAYRKSALEHHGASFPALHIGLLHSGGIVQFPGVPHFPATDLMAPAIFLLSGPAHQMCCGCRPGLFAVFYQLLQPSPPQKNFLLFPLLNFSSFVAFVIQPSLVDLLDRCVDPSLSRVQVWESPSPRLSGTAAAVAAGALDSRPTPGALFILLTRHSDQFRGVSDALHLVL